VVLAMLVVILDTVALVTAFIILPMPFSLGLVMGALIVGGTGFFGLLAYAGHRLHPLVVCAKETEVMLNTCESGKEEEQVTTNCAHVGSDENGEALKCNM